MKLIILYEGWEELGIEDPFINAFNVSYTIYDAILNNPIGTHHKIMKEYSNTYKAWRLHAASSVDDFRAAERKLEGVTPPDVSFHKSGDEITVFIPILETYTDIHQQFGNRAYLNLRIRCNCGLRSVSCHLESDLIANSRGTNTKLHTVTDDAVGSEEVIYRSVKQFVGEVRDTAARVLVGETKGTPEHLIEPGTMIEFDPDVH